MKLYYNKNSKDPIYYAQHSYRINNKTTTKNIRRFGKHSELLKITDDPLAYVKEEIRKMNEEYRTGRSDLTISINKNEFLPRTDKSEITSASLNIGYFFIQSIINQLNLREFFEKTAENNKVASDCYTINRFLTYERILNPDSGPGSVGIPGNYYEKPEFDHHQILSYMDLLAENYSEYLTWLYNNSNNVIKRNSSVLYYNCLNFFAETDRDDDYIDPVTGENINGLGKKQESDADVKMGLLTDNHGIPVAMCLHPGNTIKQLNAVLTAEEVLKMMPETEFIYCADAGSDSYDIRKFNSMECRSFIVSQSVRNLPDTLKNAVSDDHGYRLLSDDKPVSLGYMKSFDPYDGNNTNLYNDSAYKVIEADESFDTAAGQKDNGKSPDLLKQYVIIRFSRKMMEYQRAVRNRQIEEAKHHLKTNDTEAIKNGPENINRFLKRIVKSGAGENAEVRYVPDKQKIEEEEKYDGFYAIVTNLSDPAQDILKTAENRNKTEKFFRSLNSEIQTVQHSSTNLITAHFMICFASLLVFRLLETLLDKQGTHLSPDVIANGLNNMNVVNLNDILYTANYTRGKALDYLTDVTMLPLNHCFYTQAELNGILKKILN